MDLVLTAEQEELRSALRRLLADQAPPGRVRAAMDSEAGYDRALWSQLGTQLGVLGLVVPDQHGGAGAGHVERAVVSEELGRALVPSPFLASSVFAVDTLLAIGDGYDLLPGLASGELIGAVAVAEAGRGTFDTSVSSTQAVRDGGEWRLTGSKTPVVGGDAADVLIVRAATTDGPALFVVRAGAPGLTRTALRTLDPTRRLTRVELDAAPAVRLSGDATAALSLAGDLAAVALAAEQAGVMQRALERTVDYAKVRVQFGRAIGSYQAVKHACADMYVACEQAYSAVRYASWAADHDRAELPLAAALCRVYVAPSCFDVARGMVLLHGGIGYTWEHDAHLYYKRAKADELLLGAPQQARLRLAGLAGC